MCGVGLPDTGDGRGHGRDPGTIHPEAVTGHEDGGVRGSDALESYGREVGRLTCSVTPVIRRVTLHESARPQRLTDAWATDSLHRHSRRAAQRVTEEILTVGNGLYLQGRIGESAVNFLVDTSPGFLL